MCFIPVGMFFWPLQRDSSRLCTQSKYRNHIQQGSLGDMGLGVVDLL